MPRYDYQCGTCGHISTIQHLSTESADKCPQCNTCETLVKLLTTFTTKPQDLPKEKVGRVTEEFIQDSRSALKQQKKDLSENT